MLGGALIFSRGSKSERHLRKKINPAVTHSAVADPANSRHLKKSLEARHLPGEVHVCAFFSQKHHNIKILRLSRYTSTSASALYTWHMHKTARAWWVRGSALGSLPSFVFTPAFARGYSERDKRREGMPSSPPAYGLEGILRRLRRRPCSCDYLRHSAPPGSLHRLLRCLRRVGTYSGTFIGIIADEDILGTD